MSDYSSYSAPNINILPLPILSKGPLLLITNAIVLPRLVRNRQCDVVFNLADVPMPTDRPQLFLFDWSYAAYPQSIGWRRGTWLARLKRKIKFSVFLANLHYVDELAAQGSAIGERLKRLYNLLSVSIVPNAVALDNLGEEVAKEFGLPKGFKLLCLSHYYSHKNMEILIDLAKIIRRHGSLMKIIITISGSQGRGARRLLQKIQKENLNGILVNIGPVSMQDVPCLYRQTDGLLLPTLLESFSGTYVEAMYHGKPIFTSNYEFASDVCGDAAVYFDPLDADDIFDKIKSALNDKDILADKVAKGHRQLAGMLTWEQVFDRYMTLIEKLLSDKP